MAQRRKHYSGEEKVSILRRHLLDHVAVSDLCDKLGLAPTVFYRWQKEFFEYGAAAFERKPMRKPMRQTKRESRQVRKVETHRRNIPGKLGIRSIADLTKYAIRKGITFLEA